MNALTPMPASTRLLLRLAAIILVLPGAILALDGSEPASLMQTLHCLLSHLLGFLLVFLAGSCWCIANLRNYSWPWQHHND